MEDACKVAISTTGFAPSERPDLAILTSKLGGVYLGELRGGQTTHLVCKSIVEAVGSLKYVKALEWGAKVVAHEWLVQSAALGRALPVAGFKTDKSRGPLRDVTNLSEVRGKVSSTRGAAGPLAASVTATAHATTTQQQAAARTPVNKARATQPRAKL
ncbi:BRCT domain-containing protein, partial [Haematococcus lacustris]